MSDDQNLDQEEFIESQGAENEEIDNLEEENEAFDPAHGPEQAVKQNAKADDAAPRSGKQPDDTGGPQDPMPKTKAGMVNAMYMKANTMKKADLSANYKKIMSAMMMTKAESAEVDGSEVVMTENEYNFDEDLNALVAEEATLSDDFKSKASIIFEAAVRSKLAEEVVTLEENYRNELSEAIETHKAEMVEKVDSYLNYVVEQWMEDNKVAIQTGLRTEIAENFMNNLKDLFTESYIEVPETKVDLVDDLADQVAELEEKLNKQTEQAIQTSEELEHFKRDAIIREHSSDLAETQVEKLKSLVNDIDFDDEESFSKKVATVKESYFKKDKVESEVGEISESHDHDDEVTSSPLMSSYINAIRQQSAK
tara:strand:- start:291 stop:1391 length:1101 start_codon:yes stop_codon:yes gene_type:complete